MNLRDIDNIMLLSNDNIVVLVAHNCVHGMPLDLFQFVIAH